MANPIWNGDFSAGNGNQYGSPGSPQWEYVGVNKPGPPLSDRLIVGKTVDGIAPPPGCDYLAKILVLPDDQYMGTSGGRTLGRGTNVSGGVFRPAGWRSRFVWAVRIPKGYPFGATPWAVPFESHQTKASYVSVTGPAPLNIVTRASDIQVIVRGGKDTSAERVTYLSKSVDGGYPQDEWRVYVLDWGIDVYPKGVIGFYLADGTALIPETTNIGTMFQDTLSYPEIGVYDSRDAATTKPVWIYLAGMREYAAKADAFAWARTLAGLTAPPPPPAPAPRPIHDSVTAAEEAVGQVSADANLKIRGAMDAQDKALRLLADKVEP